MRPMRSERNVLLPGLCSMGEIKEIIQKTEQARREIGRTGL
mgnify:CR=1 FL=1